MASIIDENDLPKHKVALGNTIILREVGTNFEEKFTLVGSREADPNNGRISNESPMGKAIMGKSVGDTAKVTTPGGEIEFEILGIK